MDVEILNCKYRHEARDRGCEVLPLYACIIKWPTIETMVVKACGLIGKIVNGSQRFISNPKQLNSRLFSVDNGAGQWHTVVKEIAVALHGRSTMA